MDVSSILWFIVAHVAFIFVSKFIVRSISVIAYVLLILLFVVYYYNVSLNDVSYFTAAVVARFF